MSSKNEIMKKVEHIIQKLAMPLTKTELNDGWSEQSKIEMLNFFRLLRDDLVNNVDLRNKPEYVSIARGMDHWGVVSGDLLEDAANISSEIRKLI